MASSSGDRDRFNLLFPLMDQEVTVFAHIMCVLDPVMWNFAPCSDATKQIACPQWRVFPS